MGGAFFPVHGQDLALKPGLWTGIQIDPQGLPKDETRIVRSLVVL